MLFVFKVDNNIIISKRQRGQHARQERERLEHPNSKGKEKIIETQESDVLCFFSYFIKKYVDTYFRWTMISPYQNDRRANVHNVKGRG